VLQVCVFFCKKMAYLTQPPSSLKICLKNQISLGIAGGQAKEGGSGSVGGQQGGGSDGGGGGEGGGGEQLVLDVGAVEEEHACMCLHVAGGHIYMYIYLDGHIYMYIYVYVYEYIHTYIHAYIHT
jgi:hypothetical protein